MTFENNQQQPPPAGGNDGSAGGAPPQQVTSSTTANNEDELAFLSSLDDHDANDILDALNFMEQHGTDLTPNPVVFAPAEATVSAANPPIHVPSPLPPLAPASSPALTASQPPATTRAPPAAPVQRGSVPSPTLSSAMIPKPFGPPRSGPGGAGKTKAAGGPPNPNDPNKKPVHPFFYYRDFSNLHDPDPSTPITAPGRIPNFPAKMYAILSRKDLTDIITWMPHGRSWRVLKPREFEVKVIPTYFEHSKFSSFIRQANGWGFRRIISKGPDRNSYYHELFLRGKPHLIKLMRRPPPSSKPLADASTEPDFYAISETHPLPELKDDDGAKVAQNFPRQVAYSFIPPTTAASAPPAAPSTGATIQQPNNALHMTIPQHQLQPAHGMYQAVAPMQVQSAPAPGATTTTVAFLPAQAVATTTSTAAPGAAAPTGQQFVYAQPGQPVQHIVYTTGAPQQQVMSTVPAGAPGATAAVAASSPSIAPQPVVSSSSAVAAAAPADNQLPLSYEFLGEDPLKDMLDKPFTKVDSADNLLDLLAKPMPPPEYYGGHTFVPLLD